ncbi:Retrovirus-related Pol polyprotein from transposon 17.6 [Araneus ventricosus]|uniref:Retrovirus-related Pol polyprotein from transposon 17.6 n=1 Tax=Araneus ventricosus TaxID=182803 RepID=A0A4Y2A4H7_ARAVE|nr:Retrovirus-related Pol polyprotein from transposon 17.6 [Araneus ventricosus]
MEAVIRDLSSEACSVYLYDIIIAGKTFEEHLNNLRKVFQRLQKTNLKLSPKEMQILPKVEECEKSFNSLKQDLKTSPVLTYPRTHKDLLDTDASIEEIGSVLLQKTGNEERVLAYFIKSLGKPKRNYCVTRKELVAIVKSIEHFHHYLYGRKFLLRTDHASLIWLLNFKEYEGQRARWIQRLQEYDFEIQHRKITSHGNADALSRKHCKENCKYCSNAKKKFELNLSLSQLSMKVVTTTTADPWFSSETQKAQLEDPNIRPILEKKLKFSGSTILARNHSREPCNKTIPGSLGLLTS